MLPLVLTLFGHLTTPAPTDLLYQKTVHAWEASDLYSAFSHFLKALKKIDSQEYFPITGEEESIYLEALALYVRLEGKDPVRAAQEMLDRYEAIAIQHREYLALNFLLSTAYANLGKYDLFFERFYEGYPFFKNSFIAYKTRGILCLRLSQFGKTDAGWKHYREEAIYLLNQALERNKEDGSLYKALIMLAKDGRDPSRVLQLLEEMTEHDAFFAKRETLFFVREAVDLGEVALAEAILKRARALYDSGRALVGAAEYINQHRG